MKIHENRSRSTIGFPPSIVLLIMIPACVFVDIAISGKPQFIISVIPISVITIAFTVISFMRKTDDVLSLIILFIFIFVPPFSTRPRMENAAAQ